MRRARLKAPEHFERAVYHCVSRVVDRQRVLGEVEREHFVRLMRLYERLYGLEVITYCVMSNHFHILVGVPARPAQLPGEAALVALVRQTQGERAADTLANWLGRWHAQGNEEAARAECQRWYRQMWDVSQFMKVLKQRFSQWFNGSRPGGRRRGTLWEERFRSVLVEEGVALQAMAAYIDLNPVRAALVADPKDYRWCGYAEAAAAEGPARQGLEHVARVSNPGGRDQSFDTLAWYREQLFGRGTQRHDPGGKLIRPGFSQEQIEAVRRSRGRLPRHEFLRLRVRFFTDGVLLGSKEFVNAVFAARRAWFSPQRQTGARPLPGLERKDLLYSARALRIKPLG